MKAISPQLRKRRVIALDALDGFNNILVRTFAAKINLRDKDNENPRMRFFTASTNQTNHSGQHREPGKLKPSSKAKQKMRLGNNFLALTFSAHSHDTSLCQSASCLRFVEQECSAKTDIVRLQAVGRNIPIST